LAKDRFWAAHGHPSLNARQRLMLNMMLDGEFKGKLTSTKWAKLTECSHDTAQRDIVDLIERGILVKDGPGGRSTSYSMKRSAEY
jgi:Fic family protein